MFGKPFAWFSLLSLYYDEAGSIADVPSVVVPLSELVLLSFLDVESLPALEDGSRAICTAVSCCNVMDPIFTHSGKWTCPAEVAIDIRWMDFTCWCC